MSQKIKVILNPHAGRGEAAQNKQLICQALTQANLPFDLSVTTKPGEAIALARQAKLDGFQIVAAAGGDGTISEVVNGLAQATQPGEAVGTLAILPLGTGNDFINAVNGDQSLTRAIRSLLMGQTQSVDLGKLHYEIDGISYQRYFNNNVGLGFEAQICHETQQINQIQGIWAYLMGIFKALRKSTAFQITLQYQSETWTTIEQACLMISIANSHRNGGGFQISPNAKLADGLFDLTVVKAMSRSKMLTMLLRLLTQTHLGSSTISQIHCRKLHLKSQTPIPIHSDGEVLPSLKELILEVQPQRLTVIVEGAQ